MVFINSNTPYTYLIGWAKLNIWYYGRRTAIGCHPDEFWVSYFTSSQYVTEARQLHGEPDIREIRQQFGGENRNKQCANWEERVIDRIGAVRKKNWLNRSNRGQTFNTSGLANVKDKNGNTFTVPIDDPRYLSGELVGVASLGRSNAPATVNIPDSNGVMITVAKSDPRYLSFISIGKVVVKDKNGNTIKVSTNDPRYLAGDLTSIHLGKVNVKDNEGNMYAISVDDPRYLSGELKPTQVGMVNVRDANGNTFSVSIDDPRYVSGDLVPANKGGSWKQVRVQCPHCNKIGGKGRMVVKHFDNCAVRHEKDKYSR